MNNEIDFAAFEGPTTLYKKLDNFLAPQKVDTTE